jgi:hypothetical protein
MVFFLSFLHRTYIKIKRLPWCSRAEIKRILIALLFSLPKTFTRKKKEGIYNFPLALQLYRVFYVEVSFGLHDWKAFAKGRNIEET